MKKFLPFFFSVFVFSAFAQKEFEQVVAAEDEYANDDNGKIYRKGFKPLLTTSNYYVQWLSTSVIQAKDSMAKPTFKCGLEEATLKTGELVMIRHYGYRSYVVEYHIDIPNDSHDGSDGKYWYKKTSDLLKQLRDPDVDVKDDLSSIIADILLQQEEMTMGEFTSNYITIKIIATSIPNNMGTQLFLRYETGL